MTPYDFIMPFKFQSKHFLYVYALPWQQTKAKGKLSLKLNFIVLVPYSLMDNYM